MGTLAIEKVMQAQANQRAAIMTANAPDESAYQLASMALEHGSSSAKSAAELLLALQLGKPFEMQHLLSFDTRNRAHADVLMQHYAPFNINVARWLNDAGYDGTSIIEQLREKWAN